MKSISDDDLCSECTHCSYVQAGDRHQCSQGFPGVLDDDDYVISCNDFAAKAVEIGLNKSEYRKARRLLRDNGSAALRWLDGLTRVVMQRLIDQQKARDTLAERADILQHCRSMELTCTPMHTAELALVTRFKARQAGKQRGQA